MHGFRFGLVLALSCSLVAAALGAAQVPGYAGFPTGEVVPKPKKIRYTDEEVTLWDGKPTACIVVPAKAHPAVELAARELATRPRRLAAALWGAIGGRMPELPVVADPAAAQRFPVAIVLGALDPSLRPEGYSIKWKRSNGQRVVECIGADPRGAYYAAQSLQQLMVAHDRRIALRVAEVEDWPTFRIRCSGNDGSMSGTEGVAERAVEWLPHFKLNAWATGQSYIWPDDWRKTPRDRMEWFKRACRKAKATGIIDVVFQVHPFRGRPHDKQFNMVISDPGDVATFVGLCDEVLAAGARGILFRADDYHPLSPQDQKKFGGKAEAHLWLIREMHKRLKARHPDYYLIFCPPFYQGNSALGSPSHTAYMRKLGAGVAPDVHIMWTGPVTRSLEITPEHIRKYKELVRRDPFLWDNTVYAHRGRYGYSTRHPGYLFDTFATKYPDDYGRTCPGIRYNWGYADRPTTKAGNINIADYLWNPAGYEAEKSLRQALGILGGPKAVDDLLAFRDAYYAIKDAHDAGRAGELAVFEKMRQAAESLPNIMKRIRRKTTNAELVAALAGYQRSALKLFDRAKKPMSQALAARKSLLLAADFAAPIWKAQIKGKWAIKRERDSVAFSFPHRTRSFAGAFGRVAAELDVPPSPTGRLYLVFSVHDDYTSAGTPPTAWPGYLRKQVLVDGALVWEDDVEGDEPPDQEMLQIVDLTDALRGKKKASLTFQGFDKRGVGNMSATIRFANAALVAGPCVLRRVAVEVPDCPSLRVMKAFTVALRFTPRQTRRRTELYGKGQPLRHFAYVQAGGRVVAGVFVGGKEQGLSTKSRVKPGKENAVAFAFDGTAMRLFLNGALEAERRVEGEVDAKGGPLCLGAYPGSSSFFDGVIHEVKVFRRALSADEVTAAGREKPSVGQTKDITVNGSCEKLGKRGTPLGWQCLSKPREVDWGASDQAHSGKRSVFMRARRAEARLAHGLEDAQGRQIGYEAASSALYRFSVWAKGTAGRVVIEPMGWPVDRPGGMRTLGTFPVWVGKAWKRFDGTFTTRADTKRLALVFRAPAGPDGELYLDDVAIEPLPRDLAGWWKLDDPHAPVARDLAGACPDGAIYRRWELGK